MLMHSKLTTQSTCTLMHAMITIMSQQSAGVFSIDMYTHAHCIHIHTHRPCIVHTRCTDMALRVASLKRVAFTCMGMRCLIIDSLGLIACVYPLKNPVAHTLCMLPGRMQEGSGKNVTDGQLSTSAMPVQQISASDGRCNFWNLCRQICCWKCLAVLAGLHEQQAKVYRTHWSGGAHHYAWMQRR